VLTVPLGGVRRDLLLGEVADAATELLVLAGQLEHLYLLGSGREAPDSITLTST
jgi:hypothetical protein